MASNRMLALLGLLAVAGYQNRDKLQSILGNLTGQNRNPDNDNTRDASIRNASVGDAGGLGGLGGLLGGLGSLFGGGGASASGSSGGGLSGALGDLLGQFSANGHGDEAKSWINTGPNRDLGPSQLGEALGEDTLRELSMKTGLSREELLSRLSTVLPSAVDKLTPQGRLPTHDEEVQWSRVVNG